MSEASFWPRSGLASDEVVRGRLVSLAGFLFLFRAKNERYQFSRGCVCLERDIHLMSQICLQVIIDLNTLRVDK